MCLWKLAFKDCVDVLVTGKWFVLFLIFVFTKSTNAYTNKPALLSINIIHPKSVQHLLHLFFRLYLVYFTPGRKITHELSDKKAIKSWKYSKNVLFVEFFFFLPCTSKVQLWSTGQWLFFLFLFLNHFRDIKWSKTFFDKWFSFLLWCFPLWKSLSVNSIYWIPLNRHMANTIAKSCWEKKQIS